MQSQACACRSFSNGDAPSTKVHPRKNEGTGRSSKPIHGQHRRPLGVTGDSRSYFDEANLLLLRILFPYLKNRYLQSCQRLKAHCRRQRDLTGRASSLPSKRPTATSPIGTQAYGTLEGCQQVSMARGIYSQETYSVLQRAGRRQQSYFEQSCSRPRRWPRKEGRRRQER